MNNSNYYPIGDYDDWGSVGLALLMNSSAFGPCPTTTTTTSSTSTSTTTSTTTQCFPIGQPYVVGLGVTTGEACSNLTSPTTVYSSSVTFETGMTLYLDECMQIPVTGFNYVVLQFASEIYSIDSGTGVVGSNTGLTC